MPETGGAVALPHGRMRFALALVLCLVGLPTAAQQKEHGSASKTTRNQAARSAMAKPLTAQQVFARVGPVVFVVEALDVAGNVTFGSGVAISATPLPPRGYKVQTFAEFDKILSAATATDVIVTNRHVVAGSVALRVSQRGQLWSAEVAFVDPEHDLCLLKVSGLSAPTAVLRDSAELAIGERVYAIGTPEGLELTISEGIVSGLRDYAGGRMVQTTAAVSHGSSGGGLFDSSGRLVGVTTFTISEGQTLNFALPTEWILTLQSPNRFGIAQGAAQNQAPLTPLEDARKAFEAGQYEGALHWFREAIRLRPGDATNWIGIGITYGQLSQYKDAITSLEEAVRLQPDSPRGWRVLAYFYGKDNDVEGAIRAYQHLVALGPASGTDWYYLAQY